MQAAALPSGRRSDLHCSSTLLCIVVVLFIAGRKAVLSRNTLRFFGGFFLLFFFSNDTSLSLDKVSIYKVACFIVLCFFGQLSYMCCRICCMRCVCVCGRDSVDFFYFIVVPDSACRLWVHCMHCHPQKTWLIKNVHNLSL